mmetsp:Transcript_16403/g.50968  ORF Transcript_16403/g.50968 Transcript_16403/m.50968 type:complete len:237 (+) Transcript_16403:669-1379(+)
MLEQRPRQRGQQAAQQPARLPLGRQQRPQKAPAVDRQRKLLRSRLLGDHLGRLVVRHHPQASQRGHHVAAVRVVEVAVREEQPHGREAVHQRRVRLLHTLGEAHIRRRVHDRERARLVVDDQPAVGPAPRARRLREGEDAHGARNLRRQLLHAADPGVALQRLIFAGYARLLRLAVARGGLHAHARTVQQDIRRERHQRRLDPPRAVPRPGSARDLGLLLRRDITLFDAHGASARA